MKTAVITGGTDGTGRGLARVHRQRGDRGVLVGTGEAKAEPGAWFIRADLELVDENGGLTDRLYADPAQLLGAGRVGSHVGADARRLYDRSREVLAR